LEATQLWMSLHLFPRIEYIRTNPYRLEWSKVIEIGSHWRRFKIKKLSDQIKKIILTWFFFLTYPFRWIKSEWWDVDADPATISFLDYPFKL
jgi:hypothetical protein